MITLSSKRITEILPRLQSGLKQYLEIQEVFKKSFNISKDREFQRAFNHYYRVRRGKEWQSHFYGLFEESRKTALGFEQVLDKLRKKTGRIEISFASKLLATINPGMPVIDRVVLNHLSLRLPPRNHSIQDRIKEAGVIYKDILGCYKKYLKTKEGEYLVNQFKIAYPSAKITKIKMIDLVLWQDR